jgi:hypothetical protein
LQIQGPAALRAVDLDGRNAGGLAIGQAGRFQAEVLQRDFAAGIECDLAVAFIERGEFSPASREIREVDLFARRQLPRDLAFAGDNRALPDFDHFEHAHFGNRDLVFDVEFGKRRNLVAFGQRMLEGQVHPPLSFRQPTPLLAAAESDVPFIPDPAGQMADLGAAGHLERHAFEFAPEAHLERGVRLDEVGNFAQVFELSIRPPHRGTATGANRDDRVGHVELNRGGTGRTRCLKTHDNALCSHNSQVDSSKISASLAQNSVSSVLLPDGI